MGTGIDLIAAERARQSCRFTLEHDDEHVGGDLQAAALCYLRMGLMFERPGHPAASAPVRDAPQGAGGWPWFDGWKPDLGGPIPNLVKAGALIAAEIDRLQRLKGE